MHATGTDSSSADPYSKLTGLAISFILSSTGKAYRKKAEYLVDPVDLFHLFVLSVSVYVPLLLFAPFYYIKH